ncbi:hypothetical protein KJ766_01195 [Patescibacteria group bacterium]|nr:hypothetical protein [Patescibacteria group bacterium]
MQIDTLQRHGHESVEDIKNKGRNISFLEIGDTISIEDREHKIERVSLANELGEKFGLAISRDVPIYWLSNSGGRAKGAYVPSKNIVLFFENTDEETQNHELTHAVEYHQEPTLELLTLYDRVKNLITEDSFEGGFVSLNFKKNIHEFIADGRTKKTFIQALKKEGLYDEFTQATAYLFEPRPEN